MVLPLQKRSKRSRAFSKTSVAVVRAVDAVVVVEFDDEDKLAACCPPVLAAEEANITSTSNMGSSKTLMVVPGTGFLLPLLTVLPTSEVGLLVVAVVGD